MLLDAVERGFDKVFGFRARNEYGGRDAEGEAVELLLAGDVLDGLVAGAACEEGLVAGEVGGGNFGFGMGEEPGAVALEGVEGQEFGVAGRGG